VACGECHVVPAVATDAGHFDTGPPADVVLLRGGSYDLVGHTCSGTYCHGPAAPDWTIVDGTQANCGSCHALPPPAPHTQWNACVECHTSFPAGHVDGAIDVADLDALACDSCHGNSALNDNPAPPPDLAGSISTTNRGVGAHQTHMGGGKSAPVACAECHAVPGLATDAGHLDTGPPADVAFGTLASTGGATPAWDGAGCTGVYCHTSGGDAGGTIAAPDWTTVDGSQNDCGTCHDTPPPSHAGYPSPASCENCHATAVGGAPPVIVQPALHINGLLD
jgi:predicted CxxxxCH...CXXCH cytochrome family protein